MNGKGKPPVACLAVVILVVILSVVIPSARAHADDFEPIGLGQLSNGSWVEQYTYTLFPGESVPWHFHPGPLAIIMIAGELTEYHGCGEAPILHSAGEAFTEEPGAVHMVANNGSVPATLAISGILPSCYGDFNDAIFVDGPRCDGKSGRSRIERVPGCP
jgi:quercetin dioxygenase-like cupin family protein